MAEIQDLSATDASNTGVAADAGFPENMPASDVNNAARALEGMMARWYADTNGSIASTGSASAYILAASRTISAYAQGQVFLFEANHESTGAVTLDIDGVGAKAVVKQNDVALLSGDIEAGQLIMVAYEATADNFQVLSQLAQAPTPVSASTTVSGAVEIATGAETTTGSDATRAVSPDGLAASDFGKQVVEVECFTPATDTETGDGAAFFRVPDTLDGYNLVDVEAMVVTAGTTGTTDIQIHNLTQTADMLTTKITIDSTEVDSSTAVTAPVIDTANDDVAVGDRIRIDVDAISTTAAQGLIVELTFQLP